MANGYTDNQIKIRVNAWGKTRNHPFRFLSMAGRNSKNQKLVQVQSLKTKKTAIRSFKNIIRCNPFSERGVAYSDEEIKQKINAAGQKASTKYSFVKDVGFKRSKRRSVRMIEVQNEFGDKAISQLSNLLNGTNPWGNFYTIEELKTKLNVAGSKSKSPYEFVRDTGIKVSTDRLIEIRLLETGEKAVSRLSLLLRGTNPWTIKYSPKQIENSTNLYGQKSNPKYRFIRNAGKTQAGRILVEIENLETKEHLIRQHSSLVRGKNPWKIIYSESENRNRVNKVGMKSSSPFRFKSLSSRSSYQDWWVVVENINTKEVKKALLQSLVNKGSNPFKTDVDRHEENVTQPKILKSLKRLGFKVDREVRLSPCSRVDLVATNKNGDKFLIEVKDDPSESGTHWTTSKIKNQHSRYKKFGKLKYGNKYKATFVVSPKGLQKGCISIEKMMSLIK